MKSGALSDSTEFVIDWSVADTDPSIVVTQIWDRNASQMSAYSRANQDTAFSGRSKNNLRAFIKNSFDWILIFLFDFLLGESSNEDWSTIPNDLNDLRRREFWNINLHVSVSIVSRPSVQSSNRTDGVQSRKIQHPCIVHGTYGVKLSSSDVSFSLVMDSVLIEPVVDGWLEINMITEVSWTGTGDKELSLIWNRMEPIQLFIGPFIILADQSETVF